MKKPLAVLFSALALSIAGACAKNAAASAAGTYELDKAAFKQTMMANVPAEMKANAEALKQMEAAFDGMGITIDLKADNTASVTSKGMMGADSTETGTWKLEGNTVTLTTKDKAGKEEKKSGTLAGNTLTVTDEMEPGKPMTMTFKKK